jgi:hypothetical protein
MAPHVMADRAPADPHRGVASLTDPATVATLTNVGIDLAIAILRQRPASGRSRSNVRLDPARQAKHPAQR